ncbi:testis-expressed protein 48 isoform X1 [Nomascus leucogenys]|uniref:testis-expressed protein 48 isoform X1 n=1 Tax=Nomascus leucogenys TaxID=61853 RepID=UPI00122DA053|nr:testis-expressed protein 48 isoform X1 [Nomascus leucogenys]
MASWSAELLPPPRCCGTVQTPQPQHSPVPQLCDITDSLLSTLPAADLQLQKDELDRQNPKRINGVSHLPSRTPLIQPKKSTSSSSSEFEDLNAYASQRNFYKRNLNRYCQERWPFQPCLIGRP